MMSDLIRNVESIDIQELIRINDLAVPAVNSISSNKFEWFLENSLYFKLIESSSKEVKGFLLVLPEDLEYESLNYKWFNKRYKKFAYIDRIAILNKFKRKGFGKFFYSDLENTIKSNYSMIACEYNIKPMNIESERFHISIGFEKIGEQITDNGNKEVALMVKNL